MTDTKTSETMTKQQGILLAGLQALCISADQELSRQDGSLSDFDKGWFMGQLHIFDLYTPVEKEAIRKAREYIEAHPAPSAAPVSGQTIDLVAILNEQKAAVKLRDGDWWRGYESALHWIAKEITNYENKGDDNASD